MNPRIIKMEHSKAWHDLLHIMQSGNQTLTNEMIDAVVYTTCTELDVTKDVNKDLYSVILGLLSQEIFRQAQQSQKLAIVKDIH